MASISLVVDGCADVEALIAEFATDPARASLELPHMTTGQRKQARKVAERFSEFRCDSYGYGQERKLIVFKSTAGCEVAQSKNVSIQADETKSGEAKNVSIKDQSALGAGCPSPGRSTDASCADSDSDRSPASSDSDLSSMHGSVQVRNTFIHFDGGSGDSRNVRSMPHGMFKKCLLEESKVETAFVTATGPLAHVEEVTPAIVGTTMADGTEILSSGTEVVIEGLTKAPAFNGRRGVIQSLDESIGRYTILLSSPGSPGGRQWAKVKRENFRLIEVAPPAFPPSLLLEDCSSSNTDLGDMPDTPMWCETHVAMNLIAR